MSDGVTLSTISHPINPPFHGIKSMRITLCGSAKFEQAFKEWNKNLTLAGHVVYSLSCYPSDFGGKDWYSPEQKLMLDRVHKAKIDNSDAIFVLDVDGYVGPSTASEVKHAMETGKRVIYLSEWTFDRDPEAIARIEA